jgi:hypothetical protein
MSTYLDMRICDICKILFPTTKPGCLLAEPGFGDYCSWGCANDDGVYFLGPDEDDENDYSDLIEQWRIDDLIH